MSHSKECGCIISAFHYLSGFSQVTSWAVLTMESSPPFEVTQLLIAWSNGDQAARERLMSVVYEELHRLARRYMRNESPGHTLQTSALVHEAFIRLVHQKDVHWQNRSHFFGIAAQMMRRILVITHAVVTLPNGAAALSNCRSRKG